VATAVNDIKADMRNFYICYNGFVAGRIAAELIYRWIPDKTRPVAIASGFQGMGIHDSTVRGFQEQMKHTPLNLHTIYYNMDNEDIAYEGTCRLLDETPDLGAIYINSFNYRGVIHAVQEKGRAGKILLITSDISNELRKLIEAGIVAASIFQNQYEQGRRGLHKLFDALCAKYKTNAIEQGATTNVEAAIGNRFLRRGLLAIGLAALFIIGYVSLRFSVVSGFTAAITALIALLHDIAMVFFVFVLFNIPINDGFIAVVLTILGYSINDTLVVFDRIRENKKRSGNKLGPKELVNKSIRESLIRTVNTSLMSLAALVLVLIFGIVQGLTSIVNFALPMMIGIISGCYSSSLLAPSLWCSFKLKKSK